MDDKYSIQVLERAFRVMDVLLEAGTPLSLEALMTRTGMAKSTAFRIIANLCGTVTLPKRMTATGWG